MGLTAEKPEPVRIRGAEDLFRVLSEGTMFAQMAVLRDLVKDPTRGLKLGRHAGEDLVDLLIRLIPEREGVVRKLQTIVLMSVQDPRTTAFMEREFARCGDTVTVLRLAERLTLERGADFFRPFLWSAQTAQALAAARVCCSAPLTPAEQLRVALVLDVPFAPPALSPATLEVWLAELAGRHRMRTRELAESVGVLPLWDAWEALAPAEREWLLEVTELGEARSRVEGLLAGGEAYVVRAASRLGVPLPPGLLASPSAEVRALAIAAGQADAELERFLEASLEEAVAAVRRCPRGVLLGLLGDSRWQVRAEAVRALGALESGVEEVRPLARSESLETRVAAVELLLQWGDDEWLAEEFGLEPAPDGSEVAPPGR